MNSIIIGRSSDCDIVVSNLSVSRKHARITKSDTGEYEIEDLNSKFGLYVNGRKVKGRMSLSPGDRIVLATTPLTADWVGKFSEGPKETPKEAQPVVEKLSDQKPQDAPRLDNSVLYDFAKDTQQMFSTAAQKISKTIASFKFSSRPLIGKHAVRNYSEELFDISLEQYYVNSARMVAFLKDLEQDCAEFKAEYSADMKKLDNTYQYRLLTQTASASLQEVEERKTQYMQLYQQLKGQVTSDVATIIDDFYEQNPPLFQTRYELAPVELGLWKDLPKGSESIQNTFYLGESEALFALFDETVSLRIRSYVHALCRGNLMLVYGKRRRKACFDVFNTLLCRMLMSVLRGGLQVSMVDFNEMDGSYNGFKNLNRNVYRIVSRHEDCMSLLNALSIHIANVIQNLLKGDTTNLAEYNVGKSNKETYQLLVLKDIPIGYSLEVWNKLSEIMRNGPRAGVFVVMMVDEDAANSSDEIQKGYRMLKKNAEQVSCETINLLTQEIPGNQASCRHVVHYDILSKDCIDNVIKKINMDMEIKTETILRYTDYMLPEKEWWTGRSAHRIDLPFGMSDDMKTSALQITQESGQNSAVVIGIPGSGKSVFLHTIIASAITHYSPKELQLYLLDFSGVEFDVYARHNLPHARVIAPEAEREFGLSILREVFEEGNRRMTLCRENGVTNIVELKRTNPDMVIPRLLVIIDEFQKIFEIENDNISKEANAKIHAIIQEYRKFGINLILATQKLPPKSIVPYDLIANRVVFKSDPNDFNNLVRWPHSEPQPRLLTGICIYNNESGAEVANIVARSFLINASNDLEKILDKVAALAKANPKMTDSHELRTFRSDELPLFAERVLSNRHIEHKDAPREVGVYMGESIAIAPCHVYVPLTKDSNNNILIIGGVPNIAKGIAYHTLLSEVAVHTEKSCNVILMNFMMEDDPMRGAFQSEMFAAISDYCNMQEVSGAEDVKECLQFIKDDVVDARKSDPSMPLTHFFINIFDFQRGRMFDGVGSRGDMQSDCGRLLEYIMKNGPMVGVFTVLQVDNLANLNRLCYGAHNLFCHRIALQMSEQDSDKLVGNSAANKLLVLNRPATNYRGLYYNNINNSITKFKPYRYGGDSN